MVDKNTSASGEKGLPRLGKILIVAGCFWALLFAAYATGFNITSLCDVCAYDPAPRMLPLYLALLGLIVAVAGLMIEVTHEP